MKEYQYNVYGGFGSVVVEDDATSEEIMAKILSQCEYDYWLVDYLEESIFKTLDAIDRGNNNDRARKKFEVAIDA